MAVHFNIWEEAEDRANLYINKKKKVALKLLDSKKEHRLFEGTNKKYYVSSVYSSLNCIILEYNTQEEAVEEFEGRATKSYEEI